MQKSKINNFKSLLALVALCLLVTNVEAQETFTLNYLDADISQVTQDISKFANKTLILDPRVKGRSQYSQTQS